MDKQSVIAWNPELRSELALNEVNGINQATEQSLSMTIF